MNGSAEDSRNFILPIAGGSSSDAAATATFHRHMVGGDLKAECYQKKGRRKSSKVKQMMNPLGGASKPKHPKKPPLTPDPDAPKIARPCSECGKKFWSWKALFGHMRCHPERQWRGINPPPNFRRPSPSPSHCYDASSSSSTMSVWPHDHCSGDYYYYYYSQNIGGIMTEEDHEVAACLLLLANNAVDHQYSSGDMDGDCSKLKLKRQQVGVGFGISCSDGGREEDEMSGHTCSICSRVFSSGRALGGHKRFHCRDKFRGPSPILYSSSSSSNLAAASTNNYLDLNLLPTPSPRHQDHSSSAALPTLDLRLGL